ncbi:hypothetical protein [Halocola ammonii]
MKSAILHIAFLLLIAFGAQAQSDLVKQAARQCEAGELSEARETIEDALRNPAVAKDPYAWFVKGYIFKEIYKQRDNRDKYSENREIAVASIKRAVELDKEGKYDELIGKAAKFLAVSYFNDAVDATYNLTYQNQNEPEYFFKKYRSLYPLFDPDKDYTAEKIELYKALGSGYRKLYERNREQNQIYIDKAIEYYKKVLEMDPTDYQANYNIAINYYNQGAYKIRQVNYNTEIYELIMIQDESVKLFKQSLPYMLEAHSQRPNRKETLKGLMAIYRSLSEEQKSNQYKNRLEELIKSGEIRD